MMINENDMENKQNKIEQKVRCLYATMHIGNTRHSSLYPKQEEKNEGYLKCHLHSLTHTKKKPNEKLVRMHFLKDSKMIILGYDKQSQRGDINFIDASEPKIKDFFYNKLPGGIGGICCFDDGRLILIANKKGMFSYIDLSKGLNLNDIQDKRVETSIDEGILDVTLSPGQTKIACGLMDRKCIVIDIGKEKIQKKFNIQKTFDYHKHGVNSIDWHPYKSLIVSSSIQINDTIKLWDPHSEELVHEAALHKSIISKVIFHPEGNSYFSLSKDNLISEHEIRRPGVINKFYLQHEPNHLKVLRNNNVVIGDSGGYMSWYNPTGELLDKLNGPSGVAMFDIDQTNSLLVLGREREHIFEMYTKPNAFKINQF